MEGLELICFEIISSVGMARSLYIEAIQEAKAGNFEQAQELIKQGDESFTEGHHFPCKADSAGSRRGSHTDDAAADTC